MTSSGSCEALRAPNSLERVVEAFYIAKMKYEHEARLSTPGQKVGKRAELLQAQTTAEEAKAKHQARQAKGALETRMLEPITPPFSAWPSEVRVAIETGVFEPTTAWRDFSMDDLTSLTARTCPTPTSPE